MKYTSEIVIDLPREEVLAKFDDPASLRHWMRGFVSYEPLEGDRGQPGARARYVVRMGNRRIEIVETVARRALPDEYDAIFETKGMWNLERNRFIADGSARTRWIATSEFRMTGFMRLLGLLMPGAFRKQSQQHLEDFKAFAERGQSVANREGENAPA
jgi:hypothetical protein